MQNFSVGENLRLCHEGEEEACGRGAESVGDGLLATRMVARRRSRAAGSRPRDRPGRLLLLFGGEKQKKMGGGRLPSFP